MMTNWAARFARFGITELYHYQSAGGESDPLAYIKSQFLDRKIKFSDPKTFNDCFDTLYSVDGLPINPEKRLEAISAMCGRLAVLGFPEDHIREVQRQCVEYPELDEHRAVIKSNLATEWFQRHNRIYCLATQANDVQMWGKYANSYQGVCIGYSTQILPFAAAFRIRYRAKVPIYNMWDPRSREHATYTTLLLKDASHRWEKEFRALAWTAEGRKIMESLCPDDEDVKTALELMPQVDDSGFHSFDDPACIVGVALGHRMTEQLVKEAVQICRSFNTDLPIYRAVPNLSRKIVMTRID